MVYLSGVRKRHPVETALCEAFAKRAGIDLETFWRAMDGLPVPRWVAQGLAEAFAPRVTLSDFVIEGLASVANDARIATPMLQETPQAIRGARPTKNKATDTLRASGVTIAEVADALGVKPSTARSWFQNGDSGRTVPAKYAAILASKYGIKASFFPKGVAEK